MDKKIINELKKSIRTFDEKDNPRLYALVKDILDQELYEVLTYLDLAIMLDTKDMTKQMPEAVTNIIVELYNKAIETGDEYQQGLAYNNLGAFHYSERSGHQDQKKSLEYYKKAAKCGEIAAFSNLGYAYLYGNGTDIDYEKAYYYFSQAAIAGMPEGMYKIGDMFRYGYYVDKDENMARIAYIKAERLLDNDQGYFIPCTGKVYLRLGDMYFEGIGTAIDYDRAYECYQRAERGFYEMIRLGDLYSDEALKHVTERQTEIRRILDQELPTIDWAKKY
nr:tetratricopeptide repeat protein [uncultured Butyrivibrio sp.]